ncbi:amidase [Lysobacter auxotrophicus]|uniref:Amidase n=1 Tax=Lysobacter auxotrophicus TaxID=2992573 RepID=A0ABM8DB38_9GAMM|nr:amidase [Lysobacter auxotrophicus]BDU15775.1 amidase [Lysobacter auxotrophicus]
MRSLIVKTLPLATLLALLPACHRADAPGTARASDTTASAKPAAPAAAPRDGFAFAEVGIDELQARMGRGELTSHALTQAYLDRIAAIDDAGPTLNAVIELNPAALKEADALDAERKAGRVRGPLHGVPVLLKDNIDATPMANSAGSLALASHHPRTDAFVVARLREAGAVILGKTNLSEWANFRSSRSSSGWSARGGQTRNPYALDRSPCGSSSGSGAAVAASLAAAAVGTETDGSIVCPSSVAGLVGIKPTVGLVSRSGIIPISHSQDTAGPMARSVADAAILLSAMVGRDETDAATSESTGRAIFDYHARLNRDGLRGARIGVLRKSMGFHPAADAALERSLEAMRQAGAEIVDVELPTAGQWNDAEMDVLLYEFKHGLNGYLSRSGAPVNSLAALIEYNRRNAQTEMPFFAQELFERAQAKGTLDEMAYIDARSKARRLAGAEGLEAVLSASTLDAIVAPATAPAWLIDPVNGDHFLGEGYGAAAVAGTPSITVPMGDYFGLPMGIVFMGAAWSEPRLIELAYAFEQKTKARKAPQFLATAPLRTTKG